MPPACAHAWHAECSLNQGFVHAVRVVRTSAPAEGTPEAAQAVILLRWVLIIATSYLVVFSRPLDQNPTSAALYVVASAVLANPRNALVGTGLLLLGVPVYLVQKPSRVLTP